jgi:hypothetical protein
MKLSKTITTSEEKEIWFCGCELVLRSTTGNDPWEDGYDHEKIFNKEKLRNEYVCHKHKKYRTEPYYHAV